MKQVLLKRHQGVQEVKMTFRTDVFHGSLEEDVGTCIIFVVYLYELVLPLCFIVCVFYTLLPNNLRTDFEKLNLLLEIADV